MQYTRFNHIKDTTPILQTDDFGNHLANPIISGLKSNNPLFSFCLYKEGAKRGTVGIDRITGFTLDFDFKEALTGTVKGVDYLKALIATHNLNSYNYYLYTTYSYTPETPNFRLVFPLDNPIHPLYFPDGISKLQRVFKEQTALDECSKKIAQAYFYPLHKADNDYHYFASTNKKSILYKLEELPEEFFPATDDIFTGQTRKIFIERALTFISPDAPYYTWLKVGMALKTEFAEEGFLLWDAWSQKGAKYKNVAELQTKWRSFNAQLLSGKTITHLAKQHGFSSKEEIEKLRFNTKLNNQELKNINDVLPVPKKIEPEQIFEAGTWEDFDYPLDQLYNLSNYQLPSRIDDYLKEYTIPERHDARLGVVTSLASYILEHKLQNPRKYQPYNMICMNSGGGKGLLIQAATQVLIGGLGETEYEKHVTTALNTEAGLRKRIIDNECLFVMQDEFSGIVKKAKKSEHSAALLDLLREVYGGKQTITKSLNKGTENEPTPDAAEITSVAVLGFTQPSIFADLTADFFLKGDLGRFNFFGADTFNELTLIDHNAVEKKLKKFDLSHIDYSWSAHYRNSPPRYFWPSTHTDLLHNFEKILHKKKLTIGKYDPRTFLLTRAAEKAKAFAMLLCNPDGSVSITALKHAIAIIIRTIQTTSHFINAEYGNPEERQIIRQVAGKINEILVTTKTTHLFLSTLKNNLRKVRNPSIENALKRMESEEVIRTELVKRRGKNTKNIIIQESFRGWLRKEA